MEAEHLMRLIITTPTVIVVNAGEVRYVRAEDSTGSLRESRRAAEGDLNQGS
jgi:hypothetical protein